MSPVLIEVLVERIVNQPAPVIFLDTAAILDVARVPCREDLDLNLLRWEELLSQGHADRNLARMWVVTTEHVVHELKDNRPAVETEIHREMTKFRRLTDVERILFPEDPPPRSSRREKDLANRAVETMERLVQFTNVFQGSQECTLRAADRVRRKRSPSSKKQEFKDCEIFEEFLELASRLRQLEFTPPIVFVTPNKADYGEVPTGKPQIQEDLARCRATYAPNLTDAASRVGIPPG